MNLMKRKEEIEARLAEIRTSSTDEKDVDKLAAFEKECDSLQEERTMIEKKMNIASKSEFKPLQIVETKGMNTEELEKRGKDIKEGRTIDRKSTRLNSS